MSAALYFTATGPTQRAMAQEKPQVEITPQKLASTVSVDWYQPELGLSEKTTYSRVLLSGRTKPRTRVLIPSEEIVLITRKGQIRAIKTEKAFQAKEVIADERGIFELQLDLPTMTAQIPIEVNYPSGEKRLYQINLDVRKGDVKLTNANTKGSPYARRKWGLWGGFGVNLLKYEQETSIPSSLEFQSIAGPSIYAKVFRSLSKEIAIQGTYNRSPGKTQSSSTIKVNEGEYNWSFLTSEMTYFKNDWLYRYKKYLTQVGVQGGIQYHIVPFITRSDPNDTTVASVITNEIIYAALGGTWLIHYDRYWLFETFMRYQYPISSGDKFDVDPKFAFDGSVGIIYKWKPNWRAGVFWYGQWHSYDFNGHTDAFATVSGSQTLFFSNVEFRLGWEFD